MRMLKSNASVELCLVFFAWPMYRPRSLSGTTDRERGKPGDLPGACVVACNSKQTMKGDGEECPSLFLVGEAFSWA